MAILNIVKVGDPLLRKISRPVEEITPRVLTLLDDMIDTMRKAQGCGLAAVQVGCLRRIVVIETEPGTVYELINPKIIAFAGHQEQPEGCLSVPGKCSITSRPAAVTVRALDRHAKSFDLSGTDLLARAICHELDHLDGKLFTDKGIEIRPLDEKQLRD